LWIGNATGQAHAMAVRAFGPGGRPWSSPGDLDPLGELWQVRVARPKRGGGGVERAGAVDAYLAGLRPSFHGLRPLRFVLDTCCQPLVGYLRELAKEAACEVLRPKTYSMPGPIGAAPASFVERRIASLGQQVIAECAHFGLWIDGAGESCRLVDERGAAVKTERLCRLLASYVSREKPGAPIVLEPAARQQLRAALLQSGVAVALGGSTRQHMCAAIESSSAPLAAGSSGAFWFAGNPPSADALLATSLLLTIFSRSDRPVSEVLDAV
jgi:phosphomannomutase